MSFSTIPNEMMLEIAQQLPTPDLSILPRTNSALTQLLTPLLLRRAEHADLQRCIILDRPASLRSIVCPATRLKINRTITLPGTNIPVWPLHYAAQRSSPAMVATIITLGATMNRPERNTILDRFTTLQCAIRGGNLITVGLVLDAGAAINGTSKHNYGTPLVFACMKHTEPIAHLLISRGAELDAEALLCAAHRGVIGVLQRILDMGVPVDTPSHLMLWASPMTALQFLCMMCPREDTRVVELLLSRGADAHAGRDGDEIHGQWLPLIQCVRWNSVAVARVLLEDGAGKDVCCDGRSAVEYAAVFGSKEMVELLAGYGR